MALFIAVTGFSQKNFSFTPEKPKAGDQITINYEPAGDIANTMAEVKATVYVQTDKSRKVDDITLTRSGNKYTGTVQTDPTAAFVYFGFSADKKFDNNFNDGYYIQLYDNDKVKMGANYYLSTFYQSFGPQVGVERDLNKSQSALEKEFALYPEQKNKYLGNYVSLLIQNKKPDYTTTALKETEALYKKGLKEESDYEQLETVYRLLKLTEQNKFITALKKEKFPDGKWTVTDKLQKYLAETDMDKKKQLLAGIVEKAESGDPNWAAIKTNLDAYKLQIASAYVNQKKWDDVKKAIEESGVTDKATLASFYNNAAWQMQLSNADLSSAEEMSKNAVDWAQSQWKNPTAPKPDYLSKSQWEENNKFTYAMYADTYGMIMYKKGEYKKGLPYSKDAAIVIGEGKEADENNTYALLAEKVLPAKQYKKELEQFIKDGKSTSDIKEILKRAYVKDKKSDKGYDDYLAALEKESYNKMMEDLRKEMLNEAAPTFAVMDLNGKKVNLSDLKGKVVVADFWATWCGPCKASFPAMQKMVTKYKDNPDVKFVFVDTWERVEDKEKNAADFIAANKYDFHVLMDNDNKVVDQYKVDGIPTKFVIDKDGKVRFKAIGFDGSDDKLVSELTAMIDMATSPTQKAF